MTHADQGGHVERRAYGCAPTPDDALAVEPPAVTGKRSDANQSCNLLPIEGAEFGKLRDHACGENRAHARGATEQILFRTPDGTVLDGVSKLSVDILDLLPKPFNVFLQTLTDSRLSNCTQPVSFSREHLLNLPAPGDKCLKRLKILVRKRSRIRADLLPEQGQQVSVDLVRLGQLTDGATKLPHLPGDSR